jgi:hypothetical protein
MVNFKYLAAAVGALAIVTMTGIPAHAELRHVGVVARPAPVFHPGPVFHHGGGGNGAGVAWGVAGGIATLGVLGALLAPPPPPPVYYAPPAVVYPPPYMYWRGY